MRKTIEQERAFYCLKCVERLKLAKNGDWFDLKNFAKPYPLKPDKIDMLWDTKYIDYLSDYSSHAKRLPQMIVSNGLIPTLVFYKSKGGARGQIYTDLSEIMEVIGFKPYIEWKNKEGKEGSVLIEFLLTTDFQTLRLATIEALAIANWLKRIVEVE